VKGECVVKKISYEFLRKSRDVIFAWGVDYVGMVQYGQGTPSVRALKL